MLYTSDVLDAAVQNSASGRLKPHHLRDFPQQFRTFEIVRNSDNTVSILTTGADPAVNEESHAAIQENPKFKLNCPSNIHS